MAEKASSSAWDALVGGAAIATGLYLLYKIFIDQRCPRCNNPVGLSDRFCPRCNEPL